MQQSSFDLETHARHRQEAALRWARQERLSYEAMSGGRVARRGLISKLSEMVSSAWARSILARTASTAGATAGEAGTTGLVLAPVADDVAATGGPGSRAAEPYAAMVVIARPAGKPIARPRSGVEGC